MGIRLSVTPTVVATKSNVPIETRPLRILFAVYTPWTEKLGVPRVSIEIARHLENLGHQCDSYSLDDAFPHKLNRIENYFAIALYQRKLLHHIRRFGHRYDVIQSECFTLPFPRQAYRFHGTLVSKSNGLPHVYHKHFLSERLSGLQGKANETGSVVGNGVRWIANKLQGGLKAVEQSWKTADQIHLLNSDEMRFVASHSKHESKCLLMPNGLSERRAKALARSFESNIREHSKTVVFVGTWSLRKGKVEFPTIVRMVREKNPEARFRLLGTFADEMKIKCNFHPDDRDSLEVISEFDPDDLPNHLVDARCGIFPSYVEGFGLGALEMLAAGIPVVAWNVPGPRDILRDCQAGGALVPAGDVSTTAAAILSLLKAPVAPGATAAIEVSKRYRWRTIAEKFVASVTQS
jgi:glycosyltransferase involved in cell wall biosynthesis